MFTIKKSTVQQRLLPLLVTMIGLLSCIGYVSGERVFLELGTVSAASPLPLPFTDSAGGQASFSYIYELQATFTDGSQVTQLLKTTDLSGPHRRTIPYVSSVVLWKSLFPVSASILHYGLCEQGVADSLIPDGKSVATFSISIIDSQDKEKQLQGNTIICSLG